MEEREEDGVLTESGLKGLHQPDDEGGPTGNLLQHLGHLQRSRAALLFPCQCSVSSLIVCFGVLVSQLPHSGDIPPDSPHLSSLYGRPPANVGLFVILHIYLKSQLTSMKGMPLMMLPSLILLMKA